MTYTGLKSPSAPEVERAKSRTMAEVLRLIGNYALRYKRNAAATIFLSLLALLFSFAYPQVIQFVVDDVIDNKRPALFAIAIAVLLATYAFREIFNGLRIHANALFEQNVIFDLRRDLYARIQRLPIPFFDKHPSGDLISRIMEDALIVERVIIEGGEIGLSSLLSLLIVGIILFEKNSQLAFFAIAPLPFLAGGALWYSPRAHALYRGLRHAGATINAVVADNLQGIRQVKAYGQEDRECQRFAAYADVVRRCALAVMNLWSVYSPSMDFVGALGTVGVFWIGGPLVASGEITLGELISIVFYLPLIYEPAKQLNRLNQMIQGARASCERIYEIMDMDCDGDGIYGGCGELTKPIRGEVRYDNVSFDYETGRVALTGIDLNVPPGQVVALVGSTGCGKSTLVNLLLGFYRPTAGKIYIDGRDIAELSIDSLRSVIAVVTQEAFLFDGTIWENVAFARDGVAKEEVVAACRLANCHEFIMDFPEGYDARVGERGVRLSVGEKQRISIARALLKNAPILILDEATASVDPLTETLIQDALERLVAKRTTFIITHRMTTIRHADQILVMQKGRIVAHGSHSDLVADNSVYRTLYDARNAGLRD
jgi:ATP-binding cassette subfamily B protein/subfamily B ATP-binding cassette protein MsbA